MKGSIASSYREKRNAKKRSFEQSMSATAAKILKMEHERGENRKKEVRIVKCLREGAQFSAFVLSVSVARAIVVSFLV